MRKGLLRKLQLTDPVAQRLQENTADAINVLAADHDVLSAPIYSRSATSAIAAGQSVVAYAGAPGAILTLPPAAAQGLNVGMLLAVINGSSGNITVAAAPTDKLGAATSIVLGTKAAALLVSDGIHGWFQV